MIWEPVKTSVTFEEDSMGCWHITINDITLSRRIGEHLEHFGERWEGDIFIQEDWRIEEVAADLGLTPEQRDDVSHGWDTTIAVSAEKILHLVGFDAAECVEIPVPAEPSS
jgi:hypothetical protein